MPDQTKYQFLGVGYNTFESGSDPLTSLITVDKFATTETQCDFTIKVCSSEEEIFKSLDVKASVGISYKGFDLDIKASYASELSVKKNAVTILAISRKSSKGTVIECKMKEPVETDIATMVHQGGDCYIKEVVEGGMYVAAYQFEATTQEQKEKIAAECHANYKDQAKADVSVEINKTAKSHNVQYTFTQKGFGHTHISPSEKIEDVYETGKKFIEGEMTEPVMLRFTTASYIGVKGCPKGFDKVANYTKAYQKVVFNELKHSLAAIDRQADIARSKTKAVKDLYEFYHIEGAELGGIDGHLEKIDKLKLGLKDAFKPENVPNPKQPQLDLSALAMPRVIIEFIYGLWAGSATSGAITSYRFTTWGGDPNLLYSFMFPQRISANGARVLQRIKVVYAKRKADDNSQSVEAGYTSAMISESGGDTGDESMRDIDDYAGLEPGEVVKVGSWWNTLDTDKDDGRVGKVAGLYIALNRNNKVDPIKIIGQGGAEGGGYQSFEKQADMTFVGFDGSKWHSQYGQRGAIKAPYDTFLIGGLRPVFAKFSHTWIKPNMREEY